MTSPMMPAGKQSVLGTLARRFGGRGLVLTAAAMTAGCTPGRAAPSSSLSAPDTAPPIRPTWEEPISLASGEAHRGPWVQNDSDYRWVDAPTVALTDIGDAFVAWVDQARKDLFFQRCGRVDPGEPSARGGRGDGGSGGASSCEAPRNVSASPATFSWLPRLAVPQHDSTRVYLLWEEIIFSGGSHGGEIFFARSTDAGRTFTAAANLSRSVAGDGKGRLNESTWDNGSLDIATGPGGEIYVAWTEYEGALWFRRSNDRGTTFSPPLRIDHTQVASPRVPGNTQVASPRGSGGTGNTQVASPRGSGNTQVASPRGSEDTWGGPARGPCLGVGAGGAVWVAWGVGEREEADIHFAASWDGGRSFGPARVVARSAGHSDAPKIAVDRRGTVHLVHAESSGGPKEPYHLRYARLQAGADSFESPRRIASSPTGKESAHFPHLRVDAAGAVYLLWERYPNHRQRPQGLGFSHSADGGDHFTAPIAVPAISSAALGFNGSQQGMFMNKLAVAGDGAIAIVNSTFDPGRASNVWLLRADLGISRTTKSSRPTSHKTRARPQAGR